MSDSDRQPLDKPGSSANAEKEKEIPSITENDGQQIPEDIQDPQTPALDTTTAEAVSSPSTSGASGVTRPTCLSPDWVQADDSKPQPSGTSKSPKKSPVKDMFCKTGNVVKKWLGLGPKSSRSKSKGPDTLATVKPDLECNDKISLSDESTDITSLQSEFQSVEQNPDEETPRKIRKKDEDSDSGKTDS